MKSPNPRRWAPWSIGLGYGLLAVVGATLAHGSAPAPVEHALRDGGPDVWWPAVVVAGIALVAALADARLHLGRAVRAADNAAIQIIATSLLDGMEQAVATRVEHAVRATETHQQRLEENYRLQVSLAEIRARAAERALADTTTALEAATTTLVRELRAVCDAVATGTASAPALAPSKDARATIVSPMGSPSPGTEDGQGPITSREGPPRDSASKPGVLNGQRPHALDPQELVTGAARDGDGA
jgi:hypothetical protein